MIKTIINTTVLDISIIGVVAGSNFYD